ncbi:nSTAND1 domain-containing NTPase [Sorangium sp. So ce131]|uniref:nSTAND1 domain-containing NTPase n=1 Tax=Sorangium sp. So ce131 TaxID=3133282 RepID=UPI003F5E43B7
MNQEIFAPRTVFQSRYEILSLLRETSLAATYEGRQIASGQPIVLKVVRFAQDGGSADVARRCRGRFLRHVRLCTRLRHPNIVRLIDSGETEEEQLYAVFELVPGMSLAELLSAQGALDPREACDLMRQVLCALSYAHQQGIVHGDLRPAHVRIGRSDPGERRRALVCDFGFGAIAADVRRGQGGARDSHVELVGSQGYLAPEQRRGFPATARSDLYAWGLVSLECLTGRRAGGEASTEGGALPPDGSEPVRMPPALLGHPLGAVLRRATVEDVAARAVTADGLLRELDACEVDGLGREDLLKPCAPAFAGTTGGEAAGRPPTASSGGADAEVERDTPPGSSDTSDEASAPGLTLATPPSHPPCSERARGAAPLQADAAGAPDEPVEAPMPVRAGGAINHYEIIRKLGQGGMGMVFLARDTKLGRLVAIKLLLRYSGHGIERFLAEARATARCRHENIVVIYEADEIDGYPYLVLEYIKGRSLRSWMATREQPSAPESPAAHAPSDPTSPGVVIELMIPVARALICAHEHGIVHRDLKPENILLDDAGCIKVLDFGVAKQIEVTRAAAITGAPAALAASAGHGRQSAALGTPRYMSPEQLLGRDVDHRADLWAVGIMLYELLTGKHPLEPFSVAPRSDVLALDVPMPSLGERRPDVGALGDLVDRCLRKRKAERIGSARELLAGLEALVPGRRALQLGEDESPFAGLSSFQEADAARFFGRDREVSAVVTRLRNQQLLVVAGPSGAGKSSFVRAGVIPALKRSGDRWEAFVLRPGRSPLSALADVLQEVGEADSTTGPTTGSPERSDHDRLVATLRAQPGYVGARLRARCRREGKRRRVLLFVDQFEELYTLGASPDERAAFVACLEGAADDASSPLRVVLAVRSDFLERMADDRGFIRDVTRGLSFLPPMGGEGLREALTRPLEATGYHFETAEMVEHMLGSLERTRSPLPLLQFTAAKLWEARDRERRLLTRGSYEQLGGVAGALSAHADAVLSTLPPSEQRLARAVLLRLVTPERTRVVVSLDELRDLAPDRGGDAGDAVAQVVQHLAGARLLLIEIGGEQAGGQRDGTTVELVHESLIERWPKLRQWLAESEQDAQFLARLRAAAQQWEASGQAEGLLWRDRAAEDARAWHERRRAEQGTASRVGLSKREERYLLAVVALCDRARRLRRRLAKGVAATLGAIALIVSYLAIHASQQATLASQQAALASRQAARADQEAARTQVEARDARNATRMATARELQADPTTALAILREVEPPDVPRGWSVLARSVLHGVIARVVLSHPDLVTHVAYGPHGERIATASSDRMVRVWNADGTGEPLVLRGHVAPVNSAAFSPDGGRIVTASDDKTARIWNADGAGEPVVLDGHGARVNSAAFSPDGKRIVTASHDGTARVWNADGTGEPLVLRGDGVRVNSAAFSPDGKRIVTAFDDKTARVWNADGTGEPLVLRGHEDHVKSAAFSPDGKRIVTGSYDKTARIWNADGTGGSVVLRGHEGGVGWVAFSPDGRRIATASWDKTVRIWSADGKGEPAVLRGHADGVSSVAFSPDGERIVTASSDKTARVWSADVTNHLEILRGHEDEVYAAAFSLDGRRIVTASQDKTARVWNADGAGDPLVLRGHKEEVNSAAFSPDGRRIVTASHDKTARVWNADGTGEPLVLRGHGGRVCSAAFSPDGRRIATGSWDRTVRVWNADGTGEPLVLRGHEDAVWSVVFSPDGRRIVTGSHDETARVWNADGTGEPLVLRGHEGWVWSAAFSPDGKRIVTASADKTARVWNADGTGEPLVLRGHKLQLFTAEFSPDGERIVTASHDGTVRVWDAGDGDELLALLGSDAGVNSAVFSPDGKRIVATSDDKLVRVWTDLEPLGSVDDPRLWTATSYCMPIERRIELLRVPEAMARATREACLRRVERARATAPAPEPGSAGQPSAAAGR